MCGVRVVEGCRGREANGIVIENFRHFLFHFLFCVIYELS